jgi:hypothetical protein
MLLKSKSILSFISLFLSSGETVKLFAFSISNRDNWALNTLRFLGFRGSTVLERGAGALPGLQGRFSLDSLIPEDVKCQPFRRRSSGSESGAERLSNEK